MSLKRPKSDNPANNMNYFDHLDKTVAKSIERGHCPPEAKAEVQKIKNSLKHKKSKYFGLRFLKNN